MQGGLQVPISPLGRWLSGGSPSQPLWAAHQAVQATCPAGRGAAGAAEQMAKQAHQNQIAQATLNPDCHSDTWRSRLTPCPLCLPKAHTHHTPTLPIRRSPHSLTLKSPLSPPFHPLHPPPHSHALPRPKKQTDLPSPGPPQQKQKTSPPKKPNNPPP